MNRFPDSRAGAVPPFPGRLRGSLYEGFLARPGCVERARSRRGRAIAARQGESVLSNSPLRGFWQLWMVTPRQCPISACGHEQRAAGTTPAAFEVRLYAPAGQHAQRHKDADCHLRREAQSFRTWYAALRRVLVATEPRAPRGGYSAKLRRYHPRESSPRRHAAWGPTSFVPGRPVHISTIVPEPCTYPGSQ